jgi:hypothetical protein
MIRHRRGFTLTVPDGQVLQVTFHTIEAKDESGKAIPGDEPYSAAPSNDGRYEVLGRDGRGIPPGKYRISIIQKPKSSAIAPRKSNRHAPDRDYDYLEEKFSPKGSPIILTIDKADHFVIDLDKWKGEVEKQARLMPAGSVSD